MQVQTSQRRRHLVTKPRVEGIVTSQAPLQGTSIQGGRMKAQEGVFPDIVYWSETRFSVFDVDIDDLATAFHFARQRRRAITTVFRGDTRRILRDWFRGKFGEFLPFRFPLF